MLADYGTFLRGLVDLRGIRPLKVVVDAANGMAGMTVPAVLGTAAGLEPLPLDIVPLYFELDGTFPNHEANPLDTGRGRFIPTTSCDEFFAELALWLGVKLATTTMTRPEPGSKRAKE